MTDLRYVVYIIGAALLLCVGSIAVLAGTTDRPVPDVLQNIAVGSLTGLVGLLVPSTTTRGTRRRDDAGASQLAVILIVLGVALLVVDYFALAMTGLWVVGIIALVGGIVLAALGR